MKPRKTSTAACSIRIVSILSALIVGFLAASAFAHGPKGHGGQSFTALMAAKKGIRLYDKLVADGKLEESWETELSAIQVSSRSRENTKEFVVQFDRREGDPLSVFIFFTAAGKYSGSNFTGK